MSKKQQKPAYAGKQHEDPDCLKRAKAARFSSNGEPSEAPDHDDAAAERAATASPGNKAKKKKK